MKTFLFAVMLAVVSSCATAFADDGKLTIYMGGKPVASETYSIQKSAGKIQIDGSGKAEIGPMKVDIERFKVVTDEKYQLVSASAKATMGQAKMAAEATFGDGKAKNEITTGPEPTMKEDDAHADAIVINSNLPLFPWSMMTMRAKLDNADPQKFHAYVIGQAEVPLTVTFQGKESVEFADKKAELNHLSASLPTPQGQVMKLEFWVTDDRKIIKIAVPTQGVEAYQDGWNRKAPPVVAKPDADATTEPKPDKKKP